MYSESCKHWFGGGCTVTPVMGARHLPYTKQTTWFNITCTGGLANVAMSYLKKGDPVLVIGSFNPREYKNNNGSLVISLDVFANTLDLIGSKASGSNLSNDEDLEAFEPEKYEQEQAQEQAQSNGANSRPKVTAAPKAK